MLININVTKMMGDAGRARAVAEYSWEAVADKTAALHGITTWEKI